MPPKGSGKKAPLKRGSKVEKKKKNAPAEEINNPNEESQEKCATKDLEEEGGSSSSGSRSSSNSIFPAASLAVFKGGSKEYKADGDGVADDETAPPTGRSNKDGNNNNMVSR